MTEISFNTSTQTGTIHWAAAEQFKELAGQTFYLNAMEAKDIAKLENFSIVAKLLLSAVAGAVIQHLIDIGTETDQIFGNGTFTVRT